MSWFVDTEELITLVKSRPLIYASTLPEYTNKKMKNRAWQDIAEKFSDNWDNLTKEAKCNRGRELQAKWKHIRDNFRREYQAQKEVASGQSARKKKKYRYYDELLFLAPYIKDKTSDIYSTIADVEEDNTEDPLTPNIEYSPPGPSTETPKRKEKTTSMINDQRSSLEDSILETINNEISETDEDKTFCLSLVQSLKRMDYDNKLLAKIEILNVIRTFTKRSRNGSP